ncbi:MAG: LLM class flavin-dependent oxidoreductase, partial [Ancrocorticia populi]
APDIWLLGSSAYSAEAAGQLGLPYVFANHFGMPGIDETLRLYRESFIPSASFPEPRTLVPVNVVVAENAEEANKLALPQKLSNARLRSGGKVEPQATVDEMENYDWAAREFMAPAPGPDSMFVGTPEHVAEGISALATRLGADEVMVSPVAGAYAGDDVDRGVRREESLRLLAREIL